MKFKLLNSYAMKNINYNSVLKLTLIFILTLIGFNESSAQVICPDDQIFAIQNPETCDTVVLWELPHTDPASSFTISQIEGPTSEVTPLAPGDYPVVYAYEYGGVEDTCTYVIHVSGISVDGLACGPKNISISDQCFTALTADMVLADYEDIPCIENYKVYILDENMNPVTDTVRSEHVGNTYMYSVGLPNSGLVCMNTMLIEDKIGPTIVCSNDTLPCFGLDSASVPVVEDCSDYTLIPFPEKIEPLDCDPDFITKVTRKFYAKDVYGNIGDTCEQIIMLKRVDLTNISYPVNVELSCDGLYAKDENGNPMPSVTGVPTIDGEDIYPTPVFLCNSNVIYEDNVITDNGCLKRIIRTWSTTEWWCSEDQQTVGFQTIDIVDKTGPIISNCPGAMSFSTDGHNCSATVTLPALNITDACNEVSYVGVEFGGNTYTGNGGVFEIPVTADEVTYIARDNCGNTTECSFKITITDQHNPVAVCLTNTVVSLSSTGTAFITADMVDKESFDDCFLASVEIRRMDDNCGIVGNTEFGDIVHFCCEDMGQDIMVVLRVTDASGNWNECMVTVEVQNKIVPTITSCPDATVTINCTDFYDPNNLAGYFGNITVSTQCDDNYSIRDTHTSDITDCNIGTITRKIELLSTSNEVLGVCNQTINIVNPTPFLESDIVWPKDFSAVNECMANLDPALLPDSCRGPIYTDDFCSLLGESYEDEVFTQEDGGTGCYKIIRHWKIVDWCQQTTQGVYDVWYHKQVLEVNNTIAPEFTNVCANHEVVCTYDADCASANVELHKDATDDCSSNLTWNYKIDLNSDNIYDRTGLTNDATGEYPLGVHTIVWTVHDGCGQSATCSETFEVRSCKAPIPIAYHGLAVSLGVMEAFPGQEVVMVTTDMIDKGSYHPCGYDVTLSFDEAGLEEMLTFTCDDLGEQDVTLYVTDTHGNVAHVNTYVIVQDNNDIHICPEGGTFTVSGTLFTESQVPVSSVHVMKTVSDSQEEDMTNETGKFVFEENLQGTDIMIMPNKDDNYIEGVSTLDLLLIQRHILNLKPLDSPYKLIAADVNNDGKITGADLILVRKLLLGKISSFPQTDSWSFVDARYEFEDIENPWDEDYSQYRMIEYLYGDKIVNFIAMKMGDVNNSVSLSYAHSSSRDIATISIDDQKLTSEDIVEVPMSITTDDLLKGIQFGFDIKGLKFIGVKSDLLSSNNFSIDGKNLSCSWSDYNYAHNTIDFTLQFEASSDMNLSDAISINDRLISSEVYTGQNLNTTSLIIDFNSLIATDYEGINLGNLPNPFSGETEISFVLKSDQETRISFYDVAGRLIEESIESCKKGENTYTFDAAQKSVSGIVYVKVQTELNTYTKKMLIID